MLTYWDVRNEVAQGTLVLIELEDVVPEQLSIAAVLPTRQYVPNRVRVLLEHLERVLK
jgi:DNA-binding transcriptional LysR family regulator